MEFGKIWFELLSRKEWLSLNAAPATVGTAPPPPPAPPHPTRSVAVRHQDQFLLSYRMRSSILLLAFLCLLVPSLLADEPGCGVDEKGVARAPGDTWNDGCNDCVCIQWCGRGGGGQGPCQIGKKNVKFGRQYQNYAS
jgi:hypothetical protein